MDTQILWFASRATGAVSLVLFTAALVLGILVAGRAGVAGLPRAGTQRPGQSRRGRSRIWSSLHSSEASPQAVEKDGGKPSWDRRMMSCNCVTPSVSAAGPGWRI